MNPNFWGPPAWTFLHSITFNYPENPTDKDKTNIYDYFTSLSEVLPCESCKQHYKRHLTELPLTPKVLSSRENLTKWLVNIHNEVNKLTGKPIVPYKDVVDMYTTTNRVNYTKHLLILMTLVLIILLYIKLKASK
jgi:hypothetical protein